MVTTDPQRATELLTRAPQLAYAIFQALLLLGLVDTSVLQQVIETHQSAAPVGAVPPQSAPQPFNLAQFQQQGYVPTPPQQAAGYAPPQPPPQPVQQYQPPQPVQPPQPAQLDQNTIMQILSMPQQQIDSLPPNQRDQIMQLRHTYGGMAGQGQRLPGY